MDHDDVAMSEAANGLCEITTPSRARRLWCGFLLMFRYGFWRSGVCVPGIASDEVIHLDFVRHNKRILSGWDNWSGYYLLAGNPETDQWLRGFYARHCQPKSGRAKNI